MSRYLYVQACIHTWVARENLRGETGNLISSWMNLRTLCLPIVHTLMYR